MRRLQSLISACLGATLLSVVFGWSSVFPDLAYAQQSTTNSTTSTESSTSGGGTGFTYVGVNLLGRDGGALPGEGDLRTAFSYLENCGVNTVRVFGTSTRGGVEGVRTAASVAGDYGIQLIVAAADYANTPGETMGVQQTPESVLAWYNGGFNSGPYMPYIRSLAGAGLQNILSYELANEPHCQGHPACTGPFTNWVSAASSVLAGSAKVSVGDAIQPRDIVDNPNGGYKQFNSVNTISQLTAHFYPQFEPEKRELLSKAGQIADELSKEIILGELGITCATEPHCINTGGDQEDERAAQLAEEMDFLQGAGYDGVVLWTFGGFKGGPVFHNDQYAWFADGPDDIDNPICEVLRTGNASKLPKKSQKPVLIYPKIQDDLLPYLSNSQVYCAPQQIYTPLQTSDNGLRPCTEASNLGPLNPGDSNGVCTPEEYPVIPVEDTWSVGALSFPLFRNQTGGISIETDLSRVKPGDTLEKALQQNARPDYAPQFYLSTPEQQCRNAVAYIDQVQQLCATESDPRACAANVDIELPTGGRQRLLSFRGLLPSQEVCTEFSLQDIAPDSPRAVAVRSIAPRTPKVFKMGFFVQHVWLSDNKLSFLDQYLPQVNDLAVKMTAWFGGQGDSAEEIKRKHQQKIEIVPIWYNAGLSSSQYDQFQIGESSFAINPEDYSGEVKLQTVQEIAAANSDSYQGPIWRTYAFALPPQFQDLIGLEKLQTVRQNYSLIQFFRQNMGANVIRPDDIIKGIDQNYATAKQLGMLSETFLNVGDMVDIPFVCDPAEACTCFKKDDKDQVCQNQTYKDLWSAFPADEDGPKVTDTAYFDELRALVVARVNAGVQRTGAYPQDPSKGPLGPLSERVIAACPIFSSTVWEDQYSESATKIKAQAQQALQDPTDQSTPKRSPIAQIVHNFTAKVLGAEGNSDLNVKVEKKRRVRSYFILPDDAMNIEILQSYVAPMFLSPEMYANLMSGENQAFSFKSGSGGTGPAAGGKTGGQTGGQTGGTAGTGTAGDKGNPSYLSAFLRTDGLTRTVQAEEDGYAQMKETKYHTTGACGASSLVLHNEPACACTNEVAWEQTIPEWIPYKSANPQNPTPGNDCVKREIIAKSLVDVADKSNDAASPRTDGQVPGQLFAFHEYFRRMAFLPLHMQPFSSYPGLEQFYLSGASGRIPGDTSSYDPSKVSNECVYKEPREMTPSIKNSNQLNQHICSLVGDSAKAALVRAVWDIEGGKARDSINAGGSSTYTCKPNTSGAIGPMQYVVGICSDGRVNADFRRDLNSLEPDLCTVEGALQVGAAKVAGNYDQVNNAGDQWLLFAKASHYYIGRTETSCGGFTDADYRDPTDGSAKATRSGTDYCYYAAERAMQYWRQGICG